MGALMTSLRDSISGDSDDAKSKRIKTGPRGRSRIAPNAITSMLVVLNGCTLAISPIASLYNFSSSTMLACAGVCWLISIAQRIKVPISSWPFSSTATWPWRVKGSEVTLHSVQQLDVVIGFWVDYDKDDQHDVHVHVDLLPHPRS